MPNKHLSHEENRFKVCLYCGQKTNEKLSLDWIVKRIKFDFDLSDRRIPKGICSSCRNCVVRTGIEPKSSENWNEIIVTPDTRSKHSCSCKICNIAKQQGRPMKRKPGPPADSPPVKIKVCDKCLTVIGKGLSHKCTSVSLKNNVLQKISSEVKVGEQIASHVIRDKLEDSSKVIKLTSEAGRPLTVTVGQQSKVTENKQISVTDMLHLQSKLSISNTKTVKLATELRLIMKDRSIIQPGLKDALPKVDAIFSELFDYCNVLFEVKQNNEIKKEQFPMIFCNDVDALVKQIIDVKEGNPHEEIVKIGIDGGRGFLKV